mgnify:CR=1 FL=1
MSCKPICKLCDKLIFSQAVTFAAGTLTVNLPAGSYQNGCKYCVVIAQTIPTTATIAAPVVFTIGTGTETYPLVNRCCAPVTACGIRSRTRYSVVVATDAAGGIVDGSTMANLQEKGISIDAILQNNDAYHALQAVNGLIITGPTGTNVNDVAVALIG